MLYRNRAQGDRGEAAWLVALIIVFALSLVGWLLLLLLAGEPMRSWAAYLTNFAYFTPLAAGMVAWPAVILVSRGNWLDSLWDTGLQGVGFVPVSIVALAGMIFGAPQWAPWLGESTKKEAWLNAPFLFTRDILALVVLLVLAVAFVRRAQRTRPRILGAWYILVYCLVFSLLGFDLIMALDYQWRSSLFGGYYFITGMYTGAAAWTLISVATRRDLGRQQMLDMGNVVLAFSILSTYMMFAQLLVIWYENLPTETRYVVPRMNITGWRWISVALLATIYLGPLLLLLTRWSKRHRWSLGAVTALILVMMWLERWWLVAPTLGLPIRYGWPEITSTLAYLAAFVLSLIACRAWLLPRAGGKAA